MALVEEKYIESTDGIKKTIDKGSMGMALDILQRGLYAYPIQSTIRELASNGYDAVKEREVAKAIILGTTKVEDHFDVTKKTNGVFHASGWDPTYFNLDWLSDDPNIYIYYEDGPQKDILRIVDHGVGLGKTRLVNYFMLNWSSKRANKDSLGRFGLGSKVALSLGVDSFRVITKYEGKKFKFDVFLDKVESIIPKFNSDGTANEPFVLVPEKSTTDESGEVEIIPAYIAYCESTEDKNGVELQVEVKKHNKKLFFEAIEAQLMYMPGIKVLKRDKGRATYEEVSIAAKILYRDEHVVISESTVFDRPHVLLGTGDALINYGFVSFKDLEIEPKKGSVGLIMDINEIEVTPSRESPMWSSKTRAAVLAKYKKVSEMASTYLNKELSSETDYIAWMAKASQILTSMRGSSTDNSTVLSRLASIIDIDDIGDVTYPSDSRITFEPKTKVMFGHTLTVRSVTYSNYDKKVYRKNLEDLSSLSGKVYFTKFGSNPFRDRYLYEEDGRFVLINLKEKAVLDYRGTLATSSNHLLDYDSIDIPQDRMDLYLAEASGVAEDDGDTESVSAPAIDWAAQRKENKQIVLHILSGTGDTYDYRFSTYDVNITDLYSRFSDNTVVYTTGGDRKALSDILSIFPTAMLSTRGNQVFDDFVEKSVTQKVPIEKKITGVLLAQENVKYVKNSTKYMSIGDLMMKNYSAKTGLLEFSDLIKFTATSSVIRSILYEKFGSETHNMLHSNIKYIDKNLCDVAGFHAKTMSNTYERIPRDIMKTSGFLQNACMYHLYKSKTLEASEETIENLIVEINTSLPDYLCEYVDDILDIDILNLDVIKESIKLFDYYADHKYLLSLVSDFSTYDEEGLTKMAPHVRDYYKLVNGGLEP